MPKKKKLLFIVLDGLGDRRVKGHNTPLDNPKLTILHNLAKKSATGLLYPVPGIAPESDTAIFSLLGYSLKRYSGRGPLEAIGAGIKFKDGMLALRCNFATGDGKNIFDRRAGRSLTTEEAKKLENAINKKIKLGNADFEFKATVSHRCVVVFKASRKLSAKITNTDPAYKITMSGIPEALSNFKKMIMQSRPLEKSAKLSADIVNEFSKKVYEVLKDHPINRKRVLHKKPPANMILSRDAGNFVPKVKKLSEKFKARWVIIADMPLERGIAKVSGMDIINIPMGDNSRKSFDNRVRKTIESLKKYDCIYIHLKGPDIYGHDGDFAGKKMAVQDINDYYFKPLFSKIDMNRTIICVTADHSTPCSVKGHSSDPVPIMIYGIKKKDKVRKFSEAECKKGMLGKMKGIDVMKILLNIYRK